MRSFNLQHLAAITDGQLIGNPDLTVLGVCTDTRSVTPGDLFCAIIGENTDPHDLVHEAFDRGAVAVLASRPIDGPCVVVSSDSDLDPVIVALGQLARVQRETMSDATVIGITGSSGKTSTKDVIGQVVSHFAPTQAPAGSPNNELGLPLTILQAPALTKYLVLEMGMRGLGHISYLCDIARPTIGVVTNVGKAHIGEVGSLDAIREAKAELVMHLPASGTAVLNYDDPYVRTMRELTPAQVVTFGFTSEADVFAHDLVIESDGTSSFTVVHRDNQARVSLPLIGKHSVSNALAAAAVGLSIGMPLDQIGQHLHTVTAVSKWRMEVHQVARDITLINDAYNANPDSMRAALLALQSMGHSRRTWAVLGAMRELGADSDSEHIALGQSTRDFGCDVVVAVGPDAKHIYEGARDAGVEKAVWLPDIASASDYIVSEVAPHDIILFKASRSIGLEKLVQLVEDRLGEDA